ncbi:spermatogenesis-associated protein 1 isoform X2 [Hemicordylus capensis]|uniref:spermatogenesis-associated protein 1 isoform X2 n=1 Tax=Hemicordylus capensis TaxID=884348 RepID=UPI0023021D11|nr:spermatogenesis-associated protein 1 isoform X2 [Hemicordylus capensis]
MPHPTLPPWVKAKQETELKLKSFAPPYALHPELYLLPGVESIYLSSSSTPEKHHSNAEYVQSYTSHHRPHSLAASNHEVGKKPIVLGSSLKVHLSQTQDVLGNSLGWNETEKERVPVQHTKQNPEQENNERIQEKKYSLQRRKGEVSCNTKQMESIPSHILHDINPAKQNSVKKLTSVKIPLRNPLSQAQERHNTPRKVEKYKGTVISSLVNQINTQEENNQIKVNHIPCKTEEEISMMLDANEENGDRLNGIEIGRHTTGDSGIPESLEDRDVEYLPSKRSTQHPGITKSIADTDIIQDNQTKDNNLNDLAQPSQYLSPPTPPLLALSVNRTQVPKRIFSTERTELNRQLQHTKAERKHLEKTREELIKKVKALLELMKLRRYHARDAWKKKYFEKKKVTASLEEVLNQLREDLELHYQKILTQLEARDIRKRRNNGTHIASSKNNAIIHITTLQHELDQLRRKLDNTKMKLIIEIKMRKQATSDLQALKAELAHKKVQTSLKLQSEKEQVSRM